jgi:DNA-binding response OmpR family regulator
VWGYRTPGVSRTLDSHAVRLRAAGQAHWVENVWGVGYRLAPVGLIERERSAA